MFNRKVIAPIIVVLGLFFYLVTQRVENQIYEKHGLAEWTQVETDNGHRYYAVKSTSKLNLGQITEKQVIQGGPRQIGSKYVALSQRGASSHHTFGGVCGNYPTSFAVYEDLLNSDNFLTIKFGYQPSLKGCQPNIKIAVLIKFEKEKSNA